MRLNHTQAEALYILAIRFARRFFCDIWFFVRFCAKLCGMTERYSREGDKFLLSLLEGSRELYLVRQFVSHGNRAADLFGVFSEAYPGEDTAHIDGYLAAIRTVYSPSGRLPERNPFVVATRVAYQNGQLEVRSDKKTNFPKVSNKLKPGPAMVKLMELLKDPLFRDSWKAMAEGYSDRSVASIVNGKRNSDNMVTEGKVGSFRDRLYNALGVNKYGFAVIGVWLEQLQEEQEKQKIAPDAGLAE